MLGNVRDFGIRLAYMPFHRATLTLASAGPRPGGGVYSVTDAAGTNGQWSITVVGGLASGALGEALVVGFLVLGIAVLLFLVVRLLARSRQIVDAAPITGRKAQRFGPAHGNARHGPGREGFFVVQNITPLCWRPASLPACFCLCRRAARPAHQ